MPYLLTLLRSTDCYTLSAWITLLLNDTNTPNTIHNTCHKDKATAIKIMPTLQNMPTTYIYTHIFHSYTSAAVLRFADLHQTN